MIEIKNIYKKYNDGGKERYILRDCSLDVDSGELIVIMGASGCGKSTFLNLLSSVDMADSGDIKINGDSIFDMSDREILEYRRNKIGVVFQFFNLLPALNVIENICIPLVLAGVKYKDAREKARDYLKLIDMESKHESYVNTLSGGEQQRVAIARALINNPEVILADEPTGNLDLFQSMNIANLFKKISIDFNQTVIIVTHNEEFKHIASRVLYLNEGNFRDEK